LLTGVYAIVTIMPTAARRTASAAAAAVALMSALPVRADTEITIATDRPAVTDSSVVVPQGGLQLESGWQLTDAAGHDTIDAPEALLRYGLWPKTELRLQLPDDYHNLPGGASGLGDTAIGVKQQLGPAGGFDGSLVASLSVPTGAHAITSHGYDPSLQLPWSHSLPTGWTVAGQFAAYWPTVDGQRNFTREATVLFDRQLTDPWDAFLEYAVDTAQRGGSRQLLHAGTAYKLSAHQQIDLHGAVGLTPAAARFFFGVGYSYLLLTH
jgi:hypothetical protein